MSDTTRLLLRRSLVDGYQRLKLRLTRRFGSAAFATEVLNETWLRLGQGGDIATIANPDAYLYRTALNTAANIRHRDFRHADNAALTEVRDIEDEAPSPERIVAARDEIERLAEALEELPRRQRDAFIECFRGDISPQELAAKYDVSVRTIQADIRNAILHCATRLGRKDVFAGRRVRTSKE